MPGGGGSGIGRTLGFGFLFGAKDTGAVRMAGDISEGMDRVVQATERVGRESAGVGRLGNFIQALNLRQLSRVGDAMSSLADRAGALQGQVSSTSFESFGAEYAQTYRAATAGMGEFRGEVDRVRGEIGSLAFTLGIGADEMLSYATTVARSGMSLDDFGIDMRSVAGSIQANILSGEQLANVLTGLARGYDLGAEGATRVLNTVTAIGERFGVGADAARALPEVMQAVDAAAARFPSIAGNVDVAIESITRLGVAQQRRLGGSFQEGIQSAIQVFNELAGTRREMEGLFTGLNDQFPDLAAEIARATGNVSLSFDAIMQDPARFAGTIATMFQGMDQGSPAAARLRAILEQMGPQFMFLVQGGEDSAAALEAAMGSVEGVGGAFSGMARAAGGSTRTFAESMELVEESFRARLDRMARRHYPNFEREVLQRQRRAFQMIGDTVDRVAGRQGAIGALTRSMIAFRRGGFTGLIEGLSQEARRLGPRFQEITARVTEASPVLGRMFLSTLQGAQRALPFLDGFGSALFDIAGQALPTATALGALGLRMSHLSRAIRLVTISLGPLAIVLGVAAGIYMLARNFDRVSESLRNAGQAVRDFGARFLGWIQDIDWAQLGRDLVAGIVRVFTGLQVGDAVMSPMWAELGSNLRQGIRDVFRGLATAIPGLASGIWEAITELFSDPSAIRNAITGRISSIGSALGPAFEEVFSTLGDIGGRLWQFMFGRLNIGSIIEAIQRGDIGGAILEALIGATGLGVVRQFYEHLFGEGTVTGFVSGIASTFGEIGSGIWNTMMTWIDIARPIWNEFMGMFRQIGGVLNELWRDTLRPLVEEILGIQFSVDGVGEGFKGVQGAVRGFFDHVQRGWRIMQPYIMDFIRSWIPRIVAGVRMWADGVRVFVGVFRRVWAVVGPLLAHVVSGFRTIIETTWEFWTRTLFPILTMVYRHVRRVFVQYVMPTVRRVFQTMGVIVNTWWRRRVRPVLGMLWRVFRQVFGQIMRTTRVVFNFVQTEIIGRVRRAAEVFTVLGGAWEATKEQMSTGFRLIAAEVNRYLLTPFIRVRGTLVGVVETIRLAFLGIKTTILTIFERVMQGITDLAARIPLLSSFMSGSFTTALTDIRTELAETSTERRTLEAQMTQARREREQELADAERRAEEARQAHREASVAVTRARAAAAVMARELRQPAPTRIAEPAVSAPGRARGAARLEVVPAAALPEELALPRMGEETEPSVAAARRRETAERRRTRETEDLAEAIAISEFGGAARDQMRDAMIAAIQRATGGGRGAPRGGGRRFPMTPEPEGY